MLLAAADPLGDAILLWRAADRLSIDPSALHGLLQSNPSEIHPRLTAEKLDEGHEKRAQDHAVTTLSLDDPKQCGTPRGRPRT